MITIDALGDGVALLRMNRADTPHNIMDRQAVAALNAAIDQVIGDPSVRGVVIASDKDSFVVGGDITEILAADTLDSARALVEVNRLALRKLETCGKPVVAAINGAALGGGLELAMACTYRLASDARGVVLGLPETGLGLMPGAGGTQRTAYLVGLTNALEMILGAKPVSAAKALEIGLVNEIVPAGTLIASAKARILDGVAPDSQPWDRGARLVVPLVGSDGWTAMLGRHLAAVAGRAAQNEPAPAAVLRAMTEGLPAGMDVGLKIEQAIFAGIVNSPTAKAKIRTSFFGVNAARSMAMRPKAEPPYAIRKVAVLGAGTMGSGIAHVAAGAGFAVVLLDISTEAAVKGKAQIAKTVGKAVDLGKLRQDQADALLARIQPTAEYGDLGDADIVVEAVSEVRAIKDKVNRMAAAAVRPGVPVASNTSSIPITDLAAAVQRPEDFIGLHFFAPVDRMPFVEVIRGAQTTDATLARALDFLKALRKTVIVVGDGLGFYTSRCVAAYTGEALTLLAEGVAADRIDRVARAFGMPIGPLAMADLTSLPVLVDIFRSISGDGSRQGLQGLRAVEALSALVAAGLTGRQAGIGIYDYGAKPAQPAPALTGLFPAGGMTASDEEIEHRLFYSQSLETVRAMDDGVITDPGAADVGAVMGWAFPTWTGGTVGLMERIGLAAFVARCDALVDRFGARFEPPALLRRMATEGRSFYPAAPGPAKGDQSR